MALISRLSGGCIGNGSVVNLKGCQRLKLLCKVPSSFLTIRILLKPTVLCATVHMVQALNITGYGSAHGCCPSCSRPVPPSWSSLNSHVSSQRSFWHQLLVPSSYTSLLPADEEHVEVDRVLEPLHLCVEGLQLCTDGSGGPFTSDPRQRRCSYSIVALRRVLTHRSVSVGTLLLSLAPSRQFQELMRSLRLCI